MLTIFRGDDTSYGDFERKVCIYIKTTQDLTGWTASFQLVDNIKTFPDLTSGYVAFSYTAEETNEFPLGQTYGILKIRDSKGQTRTLKKIEVDVQNQIPLADAGVIAVSADNVLSDYNSIGNKPSINGVVIEGAHDGAHYGLASAEDVELCASCNASQAVEIEGLKATTTQNASSIADQGVAIAKNTQDIIGFKAGAAQCIRDVEQLKAKVNAIDTEVDTKVGAEESARKADTGAVRAALEAESVARKKVDAETRAALETERTERMGDVASLKGKVDTEKSLRETDVARLEDEIGSEASKRESADAALDAKITATKSELGAKVENVSESVSDLREGVKADLVYLKGKVDDADARLETKISDEEEARKDAIEHEAALRKAEDERIDTKTKQTFIEVRACLKSEIHQRELLSTALATEIVNREAGDNTNAQNISAEVEARTKGDSDTLAEAKAYADAKCTSMLRYSGQKATYNDLINDESARVVGNVYNVQETGANYAWNGSSWDKLSEDIDLTPYAEKTALAAEKTRAEAKESELAEAIAEEERARAEAVAAEVTARKSADDVLTEAIAEEAGTARGAESALGLRIDGVEADYKAADQRITTELGKQVAILASEDAKLADRITNITKDTDGLLATETAARISADEAEKQARIAAVSAEKSAREAADETEKSAREAADGTLDAKINAEISNRQTDVDTLRTDLTAVIDNEVSRATNAEAALSGRIDTERADRESAVASAQNLLNQAIANEAEARENADDGLGGRIDTEIADRKREITRIETAYKEADAGISEDLVQEVADRKSEINRVESEYKGADTAIRNEMTTAVGNALDEAKAYADEVGAKAMHFKGYVENRSALEAKSGTAAQGDMYNVGSYEFDDGTTVEGANFAWTGDSWDKLSETIDLSPYAKKTDVATSEGNIQTTLQSAIDNEAKTRKDADDALDARVETNTAAIAQHEIDINQAESDIDELQEDVGELQTGLETEKQTRIDAVNAVTQAVGTEQSNRESADTAIRSDMATMQSTLQGLITDEANTRAAEDLKLTGEIAKVSTAQSELATAIEKAVTNETNRATAAEVALGSRIDAESDARQTRDAELATAIGEEESARIAGDSALSGRIDTIETAYKAADTELRNSISDAIVTSKQYTDDKYRDVDNELIALSNSVTTCNEAVNTWQAQITENKTNIQKNLEAIEVNKEAIEDEVERATEAEMKLIPIAYADLVALRDAGNLVPGRQYRITDYETTTNGDMDSSVAGHPFDVIVVADSESVLNENARAIHRDGDTYFAECTLAAWKLMYCLDNDANRFAWAVTDGTGKGVIYRMIDEWNNDIPYDFKNIMYTVGSRVVYTFGGTSDNSLDGGCHSNVEGTYISSGKQKLNKNTFGNDCVQNTLGDGCQSNTFGNDCTHNTFGNNCDSNKFGSFCNGIAFGNFCNVNTFRGSCFSVTFENACANNTFDNNCSYNTFGDNCTSNNFGENNSQIRIGANCRIAFLNPDTNVRRAFVRNVTVANGAKDVVLLVKQTTSYAQQYQNIEIKSGIANKNIEDDNVGQSFLTTYKPANSQEVSV